MGLGRKFVLRRLHPIVLLTHDLKIRGTMLDLRQTAWSKIMSEPDHERRP